MGPLSCIAQYLPNSDLGSFRATSKTLLAATSEAAVFLRPSSNINNPQLRKLGERFPAATALDVSGCKKLYAKTLSELGVRFPRVTLLSLQGLGGVDGACLENLQNLLSLESLNLQACWYGHQVKILPRNLPTFLCGSQFDIQ